MTSPRTPGAGIAGADRIAETRSASAPVSTGAQARLRRALAEMFGADAVTFDPGDGVWVAWHRRYYGAGRRYFIVSPDGAWHAAIIPETAIQ